MTCNMRSAASSSLPDGWTCSSMGWFWFVSSTVTRVVARGTWQAHSARLISGVGFAGLSALFAYFATGRLSALVGVLAYPAGVVLIYGFDMACCLTGWRWRFGREHPIQPNGTMQVAILPKGPLVISPARQQEEGSCVVWDPMRQEFRASHIQVSRGAGFCP